MVKIAIIALVICTPIFLILVLTVSGTDETTITKGRCIIKHDPLDKDSSLVARELGLSVWRFSYQAPLDTKLTVWTELYVNGELQKSETLSFFTTPPSDEKEHSGNFIFSQFKPDHISDKNSDKIRWHLNFSFGTTGKWLADPFANRAVSISQEDYECRIGETYTIFEALAKKDDRKMRPETTNEKEKIEKYAVCLFIKARFEESKERGRNDAFIGVIPDLIEKE
jgi:hypothetical protein